SIGKSFFTPKVFLQNGKYLISAHLLDGTSYANMNLGYIRLNQLDFSIASAKFLTHSALRTDPNAGVIPLLNGNILAFNSESVSNTFMHTYLISSTDTVLHSDRYGGGIEKVNSAYQDLNGSFFIAGSTSNKCVLVKTNINQTIPCNYYSSDASVNNLHVSLITGFNWISLSVSSSNINSVNPMVSSLQINEYYNCIYNSCEPVDTCNLNCLSQNTWIQNGNNLPSASAATFGTISNTDIKFITNNTQKAVLLKNGNFGINTTAPTARLHINCSTPANTSNIRFENITSGTGDFLVIDKNGYVMRTNAIITRPQVLNLQTQIDELKKQIQNLQQQQSSSYSNVSVSEAGNKLYQSIPNPASSGEIKIGYEIVKSSQSAFIFITSSSGIQVKKFTVYEGSGQINLNPSGLASGEYLYTLVVDNKIIDTKKLQILR
ncbi:MAG TPA: hypothetical protein PLA68_10670, partial [Panacibacter sp.]|nr:hypothetical protein [Panacibacter sp.]